jgi:flagellar biosynthesis chaperone FliJ
MDIVQELRERYRLDPTVQQAADEIELLRKDKEEILEMLKKAHIWHKKLSALVSTCVVKIEQLQQRDGFIAKLDKQIVEKDDEIERLRKALEYFTCDCEGDDCQEPYHDCGRVARDALKALGEKE